MLYLTATHQLADFDTWHRLFTSHADAQRKAGLHLLHVLRDVTDGNRVVALFQVDDLEKAKKFTGGAGARKAGGLGGVISVEMAYWSDSGSSH